MGNGNEVWRKQSIIGMWKGKGGKVVTNSTSNYNTSPASITSLLTSCPDPLALARGRMTMKI